MAQRNRFQGRRQNARSAAPPPLRAPLAAERKPVVVYGKPFILMEDESQNTFVFSGGAWKPHTMSVAECREDCQVKELPQKLNKMTRYEIRCPV
jgi:hypothetical protein